MKTLFFLTLISLFTFKLQAQETYKGKVLISAYCGLPNTLRMTLNATEDIPSNSTANYSGLSPFGIRAVIRANDLISVGFDVIYGFSKVEYSIVDSTFTNGQWTSETNDYISSKTRIRPQFRLNRHFETGTNLDHYVGFAVGGNRRSAKKYVNGLLVSEISKENAISISMRVCYGFSYSLTRNIGIGGEIGLGGPLLQMALTFKI